MQGHSSDIHESDKGNRKLQMLKKIFIAMDSNKQDIQNTQHNQNLIHHIDGFILSGLQ